MQIHSNQLPATKSFSEAATDVLKFMRQTIPFDLWVVTRQSGEDYIVLQSEDHGYNTPAGSTFKWCDTFCSRMVSGEGPAYAPNLADVEPYKTAPFAKIATVGAYIGVPIVEQDGTVLGTLCAVHPTPCSPSYEANLPMMQTFAALLGNLLKTEIHASEEQRRAERAEAEAMMDSITPLYNRRGWDVLTKPEETRAKELGHHLCVISVDLDGLKHINDTMGHSKGSEYITKAGQAIKDSITAQDIASRTGGDEYNVLLVDCDDLRAGKVAEQMRHAFTAAGVRASLGIAQFKHTGTLQETIDEADRRMYEDKHARKAARKN